MGEAEHTNPHEKSGASYARFSTGTLNKHLAKKETIVQIEKTGIDIPRYREKFGRTLTCKWKIERDEQSTPKSVRVMLFDPAFEGAIADFELETGNEHASSKEMWYLHLRYVAQGMRGLGLGSFALKTVEETIRTLYASKALTKETSLTVELTSARPTVIELCLKNGYRMIENKELWDQFVTEREQHKDDPAWRTRKELPSFFLARPATDSYMRELKDPILLYKPALEELYASLQHLPLGFTLQRSKEEMATIQTKGIHGIPPPAVRLRLTKALEPRKKQEVE